MESKTLTGANAKEVFAEMVATGRAADGIVKEKGLSRVSDAGAIETAAKAAIEAKPRAAADFRSGKEAALKSLIGDIMRQTKGRADPKLAEEVLRKLLS